MNNGNSNFSRRDFLGQTGKIIAGAAFAAGGLNAESSPLYAPSNLDDLEKYDFIMPRVRFACAKESPYQWNAYPGGDRNLLESFEKVVKCKVKLSEGTRGKIPEKGLDKHFNAVVEFRDITELRKYPFLFMTASCEYSFDMRQKLTLKEYILGGGFLLMDDCVAFSEDECTCKKIFKGDYFYQSSCRLLNDVFGSESMAVVDNGHEVFHNVYNLGAIGLPYIQGQRHPPIGVFVGDRLAVFLSSTDIHCGWVDNDNEWFGRNQAQTPDGRGGHGFQEAIQMGVNILMYALTH